VKLAVLGVVICAVAAAALWRVLGVSAEGADQARRRAQSPSGTSLVAHDSSGRGNNGVNQGNPRLGLPGHRGTSYSFDAEGSWIDVPSVDDLNPGRRNFTVSAWVRLRTLPEHHGDYDILRKGLSSTSEYKIEVMRGGQVRCIAKDTAGHVARITGMGHPLSTGRWHWIGCSRVAGTWTVHADAHAESTRVRLGSIATSMPLSIGSNYGLEDAPQGEIDDVRLRVGGSTVGLWHLDERPAPSDATTSR